MGISVTQLLIVLAIVVVLFGTKRIRSLGGDLGGAIKSFRSAMKDSEADNSASLPDKPEAEQLHKTAVDQQDEVKR
ncbi:MAG: Sec-independent protein translocase subunit TatA [Methylococcales bacterium]|nr:Sec-independent protein translocase subunit TatA [Methylococcales bacterium]